MFGRGSAIAKIVGNNVQKHAHLDERVTMHVHEEMIDGKKLTEIINETHENVKYLPGHKLPANVVSAASRLSIALISSLHHYAAFDLGITANSNDN